MSWLKAKGGAKSKPMWGAVPSSILYIVHSVNSVKCTVYTKQNTVYKIQGSVLTIQCTVKNIQCTLGPAVCTCTNNLWW